MVYNHNALEDKPHEFGAVEKQLPKSKKAVKDALREQQEAVLATINSTPADEMEQKVLAAGARIRRSEQEQGDHLHAADMDQIVAHDVARAQKGVHIDQTLGLSHPSITAATDILRTLVAPETVELGTPQAVLQACVDGEIKQTDFSTHRTRLQQLCGMSQLARNVGPTRKRASSDWKNIKTMVGNELKEVFGLSIKPESRKGPRSGRERVYKLGFDSNVLEWASVYRKWQMDLQQAPPPPPQPKKRKHELCAHGKEGFFFLRYLARFGASFGFLFLQEP